MEKLRRGFEHVLWGSRFIMLAGVLFSLLMTMSAFFMATVDSLQLPGYLDDYARSDLPTDERSDLRAQLLTLIVKAVDGYIVTAILLIFSLGLYELFMGRLEVARDSQVTPQLLQSSSLEDLKERIAKLLVLVLVIEFFQRAVRLDVNTAKDLLLMATGILLIGATLWIGRLNLHEKH
ncbi:YqhA family protein [Myxococcaceae bacterium JPH2]|nr:YqhA family protein [Myxococcaceae bacterium JPH2]